MWNSKIDVYRTEWLDLVFAGRNKSYGAYELRLHNHRTTVKALLAACGLMIAVIMLLFTYSKPNEMTRAHILPPDREVVFQISRIPDPVKIKMPVEAQKSRPGPASVKTMPKLNFNIVPDGLVTEELLTVEELQRVDAGSMSGEDLAAGTGQAGTSGTEGLTKDSGSLTGEKVVSMDFLEKYPEFPGGEQAFAKYLSKNLKYPYLAVENNISGRVIVSFIIEKNGGLSEIKVLRGIGGGCDEEAVRVLKNAPAWKPGFQNGRAVRVAYVMPIFFKLRN